MGTNSTITPSETPHSKSFNEKKVSVKEEYKDMLFAILLSGLEYFTCTSDSGTKITLDGFGGTLFNKNHFELYQ